MFHYVHQLVSNFLFVCRMVVYSVFFQLFCRKQLPAATENDTDEVGENEPKQKSWGL